MTVSDRHLWDSCKIIVSQVSFLCRGLGAGDFQAVRLQKAVKNSGGRRMGKKIVMRVSAVSIAVNLVLALFKFTAGFLAHSGAMLSDAVHTASDVFTTIIVMIGAGISGKSSDKEHPYGHERMECVASILLSAVLFATGLGIGAEGVREVTGSSVPDIPGKMALIAALLSIAVKEWMYWYTRAAAKKTNSGALMADAWHHRSDALSSAGAFAGILGARMGFPALDPLAGVVICIFIAKAAIDIFKDAVDKMVDKSLGEDIVKNMSDSVKNSPGVQSVDDIRTRMFGSKVYVDIEIGVEGSMSLDASHEIAEQVHAMVEKKYPDVKHCMVHVNPAGKHQTEITGKDIFHN